ncbi:MAG: hypothetical protein ABWY90_01225 [Solirubrobacterales bacterium]
MNPPKGIMIGVVAGLIAVGGLAACGDDDESSDTTSTAATLSSDELVSEAQATCSEHNKAINAAAADLPADPTAVEVRTFVKDYVLPQYTAWIGTLDKLAPPEDVAADWDAYITASYETRDAIKDNPDLALDPDATEFATVNEQADALGLGEECYAGPTPA